LREHRIMFSQKNTFFYPQKILNFFHFHFSLILPFKKSSLHSLITINKYINRLIKL